MPARKARMLIFEKPYVSDVLAAYAAASGTPVLANDFSRGLLRHFSLNLLEEDDFAARLNAGGRLLTVSENALDWVCAHARDQALLHGVRLMKDKYALRDALRPLYPTYTFLQVPADTLERIDISTLSLPLILKPSRGFYSMGVHTVETEEDWKDALTDIKTNRVKWKAAYPASVLGEDTFLLEAFIPGDEYAIDVYFDENAEPVILNILKHDFASTKDVRDRLYYTSKEIIEEHIHPFTRVLQTINTIIKVRNFPAHIEVRITPHGDILPIECNPLRFAGWGTTDIARFALNLNTCEYYLQNRKPDWPSLLSGKEGLLYSMIILDKPTGMTEEKAVFDYGALGADFTKVLHLRRMDKPEYPMFGFVFAQTPADSRAELDRILRSDLTEYIHPIS